MGGGASLKDFREVIQMLEEHRFPVEEAVTHLLSIDEAPEVLKYWAVVDGQRCEDDGKTAPKPPCLKPEK